MLTLNLDPNKPQPIYMQIYQYIKNEILLHHLTPGTKLPSKRSLATQLGISTITVEGAYGQLVSEGYIYARLKSGYFVSPVENYRQSMNFFDQQQINNNNPQKKNTSPDWEDSISQQDTQKNSELKDSPIAPAPHRVDLSSNSLLAENFPFSTWSRLLRHTISEKQQLLLTQSPTAGVAPLRQAIANHLRHFRGMDISPEQIVIGAGTEYLYELLIKLIGRDKIYCVEDPGYQKLRRIYRDNGACCIALPIDQQGMSVTALNTVSCDVIHISPSHHFPTGIITPISRRYELLGWAAAGPRYIIEDDYDTEFRLVGRPIPSLFSIDMSNKVIYMNTFSKSLASTIRISYMVLPKPLMEEFNNKLNYLSCTVSTFEQYTLAEFINQGYFERHINRMRNNYKKLRQQLLKALTSHPDHERIKIRQQSSGLYFLLQIDTSLSDRDLQARLRQKGLMLQPLQHYYQNRQAAPEHTFVVNYSSIASTDIHQIVDALFSSLV
ncbi:MAG: PLP-dependent aminotransferase family protein [Veillonellaceae bacterium]|nr:PLP-dependent aminotransferase family protein [Veillonellaceae bacterium]